MENKKWQPYKLEQVVDVNEAKMSVRNYIEQKDLRHNIYPIDNKKKIKKAVEFGCGYGRMTQVLTEFAEDVVGLEREKLMVDEAIILIPNVKFIQVDDLSDVPLENEWADLIITFTFLQHLINAETQKVIKEMIRCLKYKGHILICEETDEEHVAGDVDNPLGHCTIGRSIDKYREYFKPLCLLLSAPRRIEPGYPRENTGSYMLFQK
ncbi:MAG: class I SAM-dependent methyltransferase [Candidatus Hodarchaeales archaeon]|jgi:SAM-dependent methyltransferase